jgi:PadR family transcriptional regulator, regulatory protein PadR
MNTDNAIQQMRKGVLELCTLATIDAHDEIYPGDIREALLLRLKNAGHLTHKYVENQSAGPPRKYYKITEQGKSFLAELRHEWNEFIGSVDKVVNPESPSTNVAKKQTKKSENQ